MMGLHKIKLAFSFFIAAFLLSAIASAQQQFTVISNIIDAQTGEPVPFANVYVKPGVGTISNIEGTFSLKNLASSDSLRISYVGYTTQRYAVKDLPDIIRLQPAGKLISEVVVYSTDAILRAVYNQYKKGFNKGKNETNLYFNRIVIHNWDEGMEMIESYIAASSACVIRDMEVMSGQFWTTTKDGSILKSQLAYTNLQQLLTIAPYQRTIDKEIDFIEPFIGSFSLKKIYNNYIVSVENIKSDNGKYMIAIHFEKNSNRKATAEDNGIVYVDGDLHEHISLRNRELSTLIGTLYVDGDDYRPIAFDGTITDLGIRAEVNVNTDDKKNKYVISDKSEPKIHIQYDYSENYPKVAAITLSVGTGKMKLEMLLHNVSSTVPDRPRSSINANLIEPLLKRGHNPEFERNYPIVERTESEKQLINTK